ncbi:Gtr1/RagA G protein conserved region-domain-containing protein [Lenzites betulinus]|nr:Gtr1/RagA G protein conserved region-domain-containing protein [Lenzites betulinus]
MSNTPSSSRPLPPRHATSEGFGKARQTDDVIRTKILLLGMRRSGKTSIRQVLFNDLSPRETLYLETTTHLTKHTFDTVIPLEIWDCPGDTTLDTLDAPLTQFATMIFVIDIQAHGRLCTRCPLRSCVAPPCP